MYFFFYLNIDDFPLGFHTLWDLSRVLRPKLIFLLLIWSKKRHFLCQIESLAANAASLKGNFWSRWRDAINNFAKVALRVYCVFALLISFSPNSQAQEQESERGLFISLFFALLVSGWMPLQQWLLQWNWRKKILCIVKRRRQQLRHCSAPNICHLLHYCNNGWRRVSYSSQEM